MMLLVPLLVTVLAFAAVDHARGHYAPSGPPSPIVVLDQMALAGEPPPPQLIMCAIAQAEALGREDLAQAIVGAFIEPVVRARAPHLLPARVAKPAPILAPRRAPRVPEMIEMPTEVLAVSAPVAIERAPQPVAMLVGKASPVVSAAGGAKSPIDGVAAQSWQSFVDRLARETPAFCTARHVGAYRQRKDRLVELGIDPGEVLGSLAAQRQALDQDLADAYRHVRESGLADEHVSRLIGVPGQDEPSAVTLSGVLGVVQTAGLEGALSWLENPKDRKQYPHTTQAFMRTNGVF